MTQEFGNANAQIKPIDVTVTLGVGAGEFINQSLGNFVRAGRTMDPVRKHAAKPSLEAELYLAALVKALTALFETASGVWSAASQKCQS
jgi:hypothetical protein|tara:strand:- start:533 stop:799 length:267 start_codon:yes stop_codon:yes gene_type:complete